jgi:hypothetical protein
MGTINSYLFGNSTTQTTTQESDQQSLQQSNTQQSPQHPNSNTNSPSLVFKFDSSPEERRKLAFLSDQLKTFTENIQFSSPWLDKDGGLEIRNAGTTVALEKTCRDFEGIKVLEKIIREEPITDSELLGLLPLLNNSLEEKKEGKYAEQYPTENALKNILPEWIRTKDQLVTMPFFDLAVLKYKIDMWASWIEGDSSSEYFYDIKNRPEDEKKEFELHKMASESMPWVRSANKTMETPYLWIMRIQFNPLPEDKDIQSCRKFIQILRTIYTDYYFTILKNPDRTRSGFELKVLCKKDFFEKYIRPLGYEGTSTPEDIVIHIQI